MEDWSTIVIINSKWKILPFTVNHHKDWTFMWYITLLMLLFFWLKNISLLSLSCITLLLEQRPQNCWSWLNTPMFGSVFMRVRIDSSYRKIHLCFFLKTRDIELVSEIIFAFIFFKIIFKLITLGLLRRVQETT